MPISIVSRQTRGVKADHKPRVAKANLGDQPLKTLPIGVARA
jgi:hypothetical protein